LKVELVAQIEPHSHHHVEWWEEEEEAPTNKRERLGRHCFAKQGRNCYKTGITI
jgi:hypothetical protein